MGYTNYWTVKKNDIHVSIPEGMEQEFRKILEAKPRIYYVKRDEYCGTPMVTLDQNKEGSEPIAVTIDATAFDGRYRDTIRFNGCEPNDCEDFVLAANGNRYYTDDRFRYNDFCKTAYHPYDILVKACLILAKKYGVITKWSFDGEKKNDDLYKATVSLFRKLKIRMTLPKAK